MTVDAYVVVIGASLGFVSDTLNQVLSNYAQESEGEEGHPPSDEVLQGLLVTTSQIQSLGGMHSYKKITLFICLSFFRLGTVDANNTSAILRIITNTNQLTPSSDLTQHVTRLLALLAASSPSITSDPLFLPSLHNAASSTVSSDSSRQVLSFHFLSTIDTNYYDKSVVEAVSNVLNYAMKTQNSSNFYTSTYGSDITTILDTVSVSAMQALACGENPVQINTDNVQIVTGRSTLLDPITKIDDS